MPLTGPAPAAFQVMADPSGAISNLDFGDRSILSTEPSYAGRHLRMEPGVLEAYISQLLDAHQGADEVVVAFQGGEPTLMGLDFFRRTLELEQRLRRPGQRILNTIQTNGTLLDDEWGRFLGEHRFLVGVSIDGPRELHDASQVDKGGRPTFDGVVRGIGVLRRHGVDWSALTTVNAANGDHGLEVYRFLRDELGASCIQLVPVVERPSEDPLPTTQTGWRRREGERPPYRKAADVVTRRTVGAEQYGRFLVEVFDEWVRHDVGDVYVQEFDTALAHWLGMDQTGSCVHARTCGTSLAVEHTGDVYSCGHYVEDHYRLGNLAEGRTLLQMATSRKQRTFGQAKLYSLPGYCLKCDVRFACNGGCPKDRFIVTPDGESGLHYLCSGYQTFFRHIDEPMRVMADLLGRGQDAAGVRRWYALRESVNS